MSRLPLKRFAPAVLSLSLLLALGLSTTQAADPAPGKTAIPVWGAEIASKIKGKLIRTYSFSDQQGEHLLILSRNAVDSTQEGAEKGRLEKKELRAALYRQNGNSAQQEWVIQDGVDCPVVDSEALFYTSQVTITDLLHDGTSEVTVPYRLFCGGGVDPATIKVILRKGEQKFALRGESLIVIPGSAPYGGSKTYDPELAKPQYRALKDHLTQIWNKIYIQKY